MEHLSMAVETLGGIMDEVQPLLQRHWEEIAVDREAVPLDPDWRRYALMEAEGRMLVVAVRASGRLVGYCWMIVGPGLHYRSTLEATMDIFWLAPEYRGRYGGVRLFRAVERECKRRGIKRIHVGSKLASDSSRLFRALGYTPVEAWFSKMVA